MTTHEPTDQPNPAMSNHIQPPVPPETATEPPITGSALAALPTLTPQPTPSSPDHSISTIEHHIAIIEHGITSIETRSISHQHPAAALDHGALSLQPRASTPHVRNGKIARLPKLERDMVNRMLHNNLPYSKIVAALDEVGLRVTQRNVSNWKTRGGYKDWRAEQERALQLSLLQDHLTDYLRKNDAGQLPEVGLQVAATQLSLLLLQPEAGQQLAADPEKYSKVIDMLCRLSTQIHSLQKDRDLRVQIYGKRNPAREKFEDEKSIEEVRMVYSSKIGTGPRDPDIPHRNYMPKPS